MAIKQVHNPGKSEETYLNDEKIKDYLERSLSKSLSHGSLLGIERGVFSFLFEGDDRPLSELSATEYKFIKDSLLVDLTGDPSKKGRSALKTRSIFEKVVTPEPLEAGLLESLKGKISEEDLEDLSVLPLSYLIANLDFSLDKRLSVDMKALLLMEVYKSFIFDNPEEKLHEGSIKIEVLAQLIVRLKAIQEDLYRSTEPLKSIKDSSIEFLEDVRSFSIDTYTSMLAKLLRGTTFAPDLSLLSFSRNLELASKFLASHVDIYRNTHMKALNAHFFDGGLYSIFTDEAEEPYFADNGDFIQSDPLKAVREDEGLVLILEEFYKETSKALKDSKKPLWGSYSDLMPTLKELEENFSQLIHSYVRGQSKEELKEALKGTSLPKYEMDALITSLINELDEIFEDDFFEDEWLEDE